MKIPGAGDLNRRIVIRSWGETPNVSMGSDAVYGAPLAVWASVQPVGGAIYYGSMQIDATVTHRFIIRTNPTVTAQHVIEHEGQRFRIRRINTMADAVHFTIIDAEEMGPAT